MKNLLPYCRTKTQEKALKAVIKHGSNQKAAAALGVNRRAIDKAVNRIKGYTKNPDNHKPQQVTKKRAVEPSCGYVVTSAQNDTPVHAKFLASMLRYCKAKNYQLIVIPTHYKNPSAFGSSKDYEWSDSVKPYLLSDDFKPCKNLRIMGSIKIQPTATRPLSSLDTISGCDSAIFGHPKVALRSIATKSNSMAKLIYTTGSVTKKNYSDSKAGRKGEFHHVLGAVVVEIDGNKFHARNISAQGDGSFADLDYKWSATGREKIKSVPVITLGDLHAEQASESALVCYEKVRKLLRPKRLVLHDVLNFGSASYHNTFMERFEKFHAGTDSVRSELELTCKMLDDLAAGVYEVVMVASNHNDHFTKWLESEKNCNDLRNARIFAETRAYYLKELEEGRRPVSPLAYWASQWCKNFHKMRFLDRDEGYSINGVELSYHGDKGPGGARGSTMNLAKIGSKSTKGHDHQATIIDGCYSAGTMSILNPSYTHGSPSAWINSMVVQYQNGKRTHINSIDGEFRGKK